MSTTTNDRETQGVDSTVDTPDTLDAMPADAEPIRRRERRSTSHLKAVPETLAQREEIKAAAEAYARGLDKARPFTKNELEDFARDLLQKHDWPEKYLGFAMVLIGNFFWKQQFLALPFERRMLLLPHCLKHAEGCPADYDEFGLDCEKCGACSIADYKVKAEQLGYKVLVAEGSPVVLKIIISGHIDGILGVSCLNVLEKAIDKVLIAGVPSYAIPLHTGDCKSTTLDEAWVWDVLDKYEPLPEPSTASYVPLMRAANELFDRHFAEVLPPLRTKGIAAGAAPSPVALTEAAANDWLQHGGRRFRPFITLAAYDALTGANGTKVAPGQPLPRYSTGVSRVAMAIEAFHKASLVHDDIQDDDEYRYGRETLHRQHGIGQAINIGDYLIGQGYRLVTAARGEIGAEAAADILDRMAAAHLKLCDGQGAEMAWLATPQQHLTPLDALQIYALKTSPAFEAALYAGVRMAGPTPAYDELIPAFCRHLGVGFQILNDLNDWRGDDYNKMLAGQDALSMRPTLLLALAFEAATPTQKAELQDVLTSQASAESRLKQLRGLYQACGVFAKAEALIEKSRARAEALADAIEPLPFRQFLYFMVDNILAEEAPAPQIPPAAIGLPIISRP